MKTPSLDEQQAIACLKRGNLAGMETLVSSYQVKAVYTAYLIVHDMPLAEDIVQNAFLHAAEKIDQFDMRKPFAPWFLRSVIHNAIKAAERQKLVAPLHDVPDEDGSEMAAWLLDPNPGPEEFAETEETRRVVWRALEQLSPEQRAVVIMHHFLEMDETEMTQETGRPVTTVRWWLRAARVRLRGLLQHFWLSRDGFDEKRQD